MAALSIGSHSVVQVTGGTFTQVNNNNNLQERLKISWDRLQAAVAPAAFHNSAERFDPPRCHPNTRVAVLDELIDWVIRRGDAGHMRIFWLRGPAGAGKTAIAQTLCELCFSQRFLLAAFFFNRSDSSRNNPKQLVATLAYQIYGMVPQRYKALILGVIEDDPLVFDRSIEAQIKALIMDPLQDLFEVSYFNNYDAPRLIVLDGLDECFTGAAQVNILTAVQTILKRLNTPFIVLIASRPEHDIQMFFKSSCLGSLIRRLDLDDSYRSYADIELFLREKIEEACADHPLKHSIPQGWPSSKAMEELVQKSSGQFIYASVVVKYVTSNRHYPPHRLDVVRQLRPPKRNHLPFTELDALYSHILSCVEDITLVLRILRIVILFGGKNFNTEDIEQLCDLDQGECLSALCDLHSVLEVDLSIRLLHKSLPDYLHDPSRSHQYHIDTTPGAVTPIVTQCLGYICDLEVDYNPRYTDFISQHLQLLVTNVQLCQKDLMSFSLINCWKAYYATDTALGKHPWRHRDNLVFFTLRFFENLCTLEGTAYKHIWDHHLRQFSQIHGVDQIVTSGSHFPLLNVIILTGNSDIQIPPKAFELGEQLGIPFKFDTCSRPHVKSEILALVSISGYNALCSAAAQRCINSLMHDSSPKSAAFALAWLCVAIPGARLSPELNEACLPKKPFAYAASGDHGLSGLHRAYSVMQRYRDRYAAAQPMQHKKIGD